MEECELINIAFLFVRCICKVEGKGCTLFLGMVIGLLLCDRSRNGYVQLH